MAKEKGTHYLYLGGGQSFVLAQILEARTKSGEGSEYTRSLRKKISDVDKTGRAYLMLTDSEIDALQDAMEPMVSPLDSTGHYARGITVADENQYPPTWSKYSTPYPKELEE